MLYKVGVLHDRGSLPFSITNNKTLLVVTFSEILVKENT